MAFDLDRASHAQASQNSKLFQFLRRFPAEGFSGLKERRFSHAHVGPPERAIVDRTLSTSFIAALPADERERVAARIRELIAATPSLADKSEVAHPYETRAFSCVEER